jgi:hypothetical protein
MDHIYDTNSDFDFNKLILSKPISQNGNYFIKYSINDFPLYIRPPKSTIKQLIKNLKKTQCDLIFSQENEEFIQWMENLENHSQQIIYKNREQWFESGLQLEDIENSFTSPMKTYKSGKFYIVRTNITQRLGKINLKIYNEDETNLPFEDISMNLNVMTILEIQGIKCSSKSFQIDIEMKQMMVLNTIDLFEKCILNKTRNETANVVNLGKIENKINDESLEELINENKSLEEITEIKEKKEELEITNKKENKQDFLEIKEEKNKYENQNELCEVDFNLEEMPEIETFKLKERDDVYYEMYKEARRKAKIAKDLALSAYLEAKDIKNKYMLDDISDSDESDIDEDE